MHWVDRGVEPTGLRQIFVQYTPRWIRYYRHGEGNKPPSDTRWRDFHDDLEAAFSGLCAYCEETCRGTVDHFRPKSKFPELVYVWSNWLFSCFDCNNAKLNKWPNEGYIDPCEDSQHDRPEAYFDFDFETGRMMAKTNLDSSRRERAEKIICDLKLNRRHHRKKRVVVLKKLSMLEDCPASERIDTLRLSFALRTEEVSSFARAWLSKEGYL